MVKTLHQIFLLAVLFTFCTAAHANQPATVESENIAIENEINAIAISVEDNVLHVKNAEGTVVEIYSITGEKVFTQRIDSNNKSVELSNLQKGCYIVRIGKLTRKISLR